MMFCSKGKKEDDASLSILINQDETAVHWITQRRSQKPNFPYILNLFELKSCSFGHHLTIFSVFLVFENALFAHRQPRGHGPVIMRTTVSALMRLKDKLCNQW